MRSDAIVATGRSDYPNQVNNVLGFPFIFRGALDVQASTINEAMKIAAAKALAELAREDVPDQVAAAYLGRQVDVRARLHHPGAVRSAPDHARAAGRRQGGDGYRRGAQADRRHGRLRRAALGPARPGRRLAAAASSTRCAMRPSASSSPRARSRRSRAPPTPSTTPACGTPILIGRDAPITRGLRHRRHRPHRRHRDPRHQPATTAATSTPSSSTARLQRKGYLLRDCQRLVNNDRNVFAACMVAMGHADGMVTGVTRNWYTAYEDVRKVLDARARPARDRRVARR